MRRHRFVDQAQIGAGKKGFGGIDLGAKMPDRDVGGGICKRVETDGERLGLGVGDEINLSAVLMGTKVDAHET